MTARYTVKFTNGYWKVFDTENYTDFAIHFLKSEANLHRNRLNKGSKK